MPNHPTGVVTPEYRGRLRAEERVDGYRVVRTWLYATPNEGVAKKTLGHLSFMVTSMLLGGRRSGSADIVVVSSPTFFSIFAAWVLAKVKRASLVVEIRDLWPAIFVELGVLRNAALIRALEFLELTAYRAADRVVVVSDGFRDNLITRGVPAAKVTTIRNGVDLDRFTPTSPDPAVRKRLGAAEGEVLALYIGAHGISHGLTAVADAGARAAKAGVHLTFVGEGADKGRLTAHVEHMDNVTLLPGVPRALVPSMLAAADICLVPLRDVPLFRTFIPSKLFEYLAAGKAVVGAVRGESAEILRGAGAVVVPPEDVDAMVGAIEELANDPERRAEMGRRGRAYVSGQFDRRLLADRYRQEVLLPAIGSSR
jgi:glycosyltransferase involved in cell wall biosynthesis